MFVDGPEGTIRWYVARDDAPPLPFDSCILSRDWDANRWDTYEIPDDVGESNTAPQSYNGQVSVPTAVADTICGEPEQFLGDSQWDPEAPIVERRPDGLPACCGWFVAGSGGIADGGSATVVVEPPVEPGATCDDAFIMALDTTYVASWPVSSEHWWGWDLPPGTYRLITTGFPPVLSPGIILLAPDPDFPCSAFFFLEVEADCIGVDPVRRMRVGSYPTAPVPTYSLRIEAGTCPP